MMRRWIELWDGEEAAWPLAMVRLLLGAAMFGDYLTIAWRGLVQSVFVSEAFGGLLDSTRSVPVPWWAWMGDGEASGLLLYGLLLLTSFTLMVGLFTRTSAVALMLLSAQMAWLHPAGDRGIDTLMRNVLMMLMFSGAGQALSVDAWLRCRSWLGDGALISRWPRRLLLLQLVVMYFAAGVSKYAQQWWPWGGYTALYVIWHDWAVSAVAGQEWLATTAALRFAQLATFLSITWELTFPVMLWFWLAWGRGRPDWVRRWRPDLAYVALGILFHLGIAVWLDLGVFPWAMLALYPAFLSGREWSRVFDAIRRRNLRDVAEALRIGP